MADNKEEEKHMTVDRTANSQSVRLSSYDQQPEQNYPQPIVAKLDNRINESMYSVEDVRTLSQWVKYKPKIICLYFILAAVDICLVITCILYLVHHGVPMNHRTKLTYRSCADIVSVIYRCIILFLCWWFINELLFGPVFTNDEQHVSISIMQQQIQQQLQQPLLNVNNNNKQVNYKCWKKILYMFQYMFKDLQLNQFTIAALLCAVHQIFNAGLLWIAVYNGADGWYILSGFTYFLGAFAITVPGVCLNQFVRFHHKRKKRDLQSQNDPEATIITDLTKLDRIEHTILSESTVRQLILLAFVIELLQFMFVPAMNHSDVITMQNIIYDCQGDTNCDIRADFVVCELVFRIFVGMAILNNIVLLGSILLDNHHTDTSLTNMAKLFNPVCYLFLFLALLMDLRITDSYWETEFKVVEWFWIVIHIISVGVIVRVYYHFFNLDLQINLAPIKRRDIKAPMSLLCEARLLAVLAFIATLFVSMDQNLFKNLHKPGNITIVRQCVMIFYHAMQILIWKKASRIQQVPSFPSKLGDNAEKWRGCFGSYGCCVWLAFINLYDFVYSFMFEAREYDQMMDGNEIDKGEHSNVLFYKWSYSFSFAVSHLMLWSLCCSVEFLVRYNEEKGVNDGQDDGQDGQGDGQDGQDGHDDGQDGHDDGQDGHDDGQDVQLDNGNQIIEEDEVQNGQRKIKKQTI
eukprot:206491_1